VRFRFGAARQRVLYCILARSEEEWGEFRGRGEEDTWCTLISPSPLFPGWAPTQRMHSDRLIIIAVQYRKEEPEKEGLLLFLENKLYFAALINYFSEFKLLLL
jgi:hypothetical protein